LIKRLANSTDRLIDRTNRLAFSAGDLAVVALNGIATWYRPDGEKTIEQISDDYSNLFLNGLLR